MEKKNNYFLELFGNGGIYSLNIERQINENISFRIGGSTYLRKGKSIDYYFHNHLAAPIMINFFKRKNRFIFEVGVGINLMYFFPIKDDSFLGESALVEEFNQYETGFYPIGRLGVTFLPFNNRLNLKIALTSNSFSNLPTIGFGVGYLSK